MVTIGVKNTIVLPPKKILQTGKDIGKELSKYGWNCPE
jgi:hypothetical protein